MWASRASLIVAAWALALGASFFAGWWTNGMRLTNKHSQEQLRLYDAAQDVVAKHDLESKVILDDYRKKLVAANARHPKRVFICPNDDLPKSTGGASGAGAGQPDRRADGTDLGNHDYGPELRAARDALIRCNALIKEVTP